jgi:hypothetical protein
MYIVSGSEGYALKFRSRAEIEGMAKQLLDMPPEATVYMMGQDTTPEGLLNNFVHSVKVWDEPEVYVPPTSPEPGLQKVWDSSYTVMYWPRIPIPGIAYTEHLMSFVDVIIQASCKIFEMSRMPLAQDLYIHSSVLPIIQALPGFRISGPTVYHHDGEIGVLNCAWTVRCNDTVLSKNSAMLVGSGGSVIIAVTGCWE